MGPRASATALLLGFLSLLAGARPLRGAAAKPHTAVLGAVKAVPYSIEGDPSGALPEEKSLGVRPLLIDGKLKEWTTGQSHDITDRSFVVRRALRINDELPGDKALHWVWQRGPWLLIDRAKGTITALHLPDYEPTVSDVVWFRDYGAYCGLSTSGKELYAVVAQVAAHKPLLSKKLSTWTPGQDSRPACAAAIWQREPLQVTFQRTGQAAVSYDLVGLSSVLVEDDDGNDSSAAPSSNE
jgi:hypothetical protein